MPERRTVEVEGMSCTGCEGSIESALTNLAGVRRVEADHEAGTVEVVVDDDVDDDAVDAAVHDAGYDVVA